MGEKYAAEVNVPRVVQDDRIGLAGEGRTCILRRCLHVLHRRHRGLIGWLVEEDPLDRDVQARQCSLLTRRILSRSLAGCYGAR